MSGILMIVSQVLAIVLAIVVAVERPGEGSEKRAQAIKGIKDVLGMLPLPGWVMTIFGNDMVLGVLVNALVNTLNKTGWLTPAANVAGLAAAAAKL